MLKLTPRLTTDIPNALLEQMANLPVFMALNSASQQTIARLLAGRGVTDMAEMQTAIGTMLPAIGLKGLEQAVRFIDNAIDNQQKILIVGDFDCDGATSTALMVRVLREMGANVEFLVPDRFKYGYGLTPEIVALGRETFSPDMIITVDNGISSYEGVQIAKDHGIIVIITDHHLTTQAPPNADAVVNPNQLNCDFSSKSLVGVGVAFYVLGNLAKVRRQAGKTTVQVTRYLDLVALGTVADVGVLDQNNRLLVHHGMTTIRQRQCSIGILAILEQAGRDPEAITVQDFGFIIAPRINAAGRMDNMRIGIECLITDDWGRAGQLAHELDKLNRERRGVETAMRVQAEAILQNLAVTEQQKSLILYQDDWHQGVIGIVAGRLKEQFHLPAIVFAPADTEATGDTDMIKGSARSIAGIHIRDAIEAVAQAHPELISHFGGHAMAAGLTIERRNFEAFANAFNQVINEVPETVFTQTWLTDGQLSPADFSLEFADVLENMTIWGHGFLPPVFDGVFVIQDFRVLKERHLKLWLSHAGMAFAIEAIWFNADFDKVNVANINRTISRVHVLYELGKNDYNGQVKLQLMVKNAVLLP